MKKFEKKRIRVSSKPIMIIGVKPGKQRMGERTYKVWEGNRSGDFINNIVKDLKNILLTNVCNYKDPTPPKRTLGIYELISDIKINKPRKIICLGKHPFNIVKQYKLDEKFKTVKLLHPSYVLRFNKDVKNYRKKLIYHLKK